MWSVAQADSTDQYIKGNVVYVVLGTLLPAEIADDASIYLSRYSGWACQTHWSQSVVSWSSVASLCLVVSMLDA